MYTVASVDLTNPFADKKVIEPQRRIAELVILDLPAGASFRMRLGDERNAYFTVSRPFSMEPVGDDEAAGGLFVTNLAGQAGVIIELIVVWGDGKRDQINAIV